MAKRLVPFKSSFSKIPLHTVMEHIRFSCILYISHKEDEIAMFFNQGYLFDIRQNNNFLNKEELENITNLEEGTFCFAQFDKGYETETKYISDVLHLGKALKNKFELSLSDGSHSGKIYVEEGTMQHAVYDNEEGLSAINKILNSKTGIVRIEEFTTENKDSNNSEEKETGKTKVEEPESTETGKTKTDNDDAKKFQPAIETLKTDLAESLIAFCLWSATQDSIIASYNPEDRDISMLKTLTKNIDQELLDAKHVSSESPHYYLLKLSSNELILIMHLDGYAGSIVVNRTKISFGMLMNIIVPNLQKAFENAL